MNRFRHILCVFCLMLVACTANDSISRENRCQFIFDTTLHPLPCHLTGILGNNGHFCQVQTYVDNKGMAQFNYYLGANDCIIIGTSSYDFTLLTWDGQCPNCLTDYGGYSYPLTWQDNGHKLHCAKCSRSYDVNNGVVADGASGRQLLRYYAALENGLIRAWN